MPRLWTETIQAHRREVSDAILDSTAALVAAHGLRSVTMSQIAEQTGIGRATLYKYFPDVEAILLTWHERQVTGHLEQLEQLRDEPGQLGERLEAVLQAYALIHYELAGHRRLAGHDRHSRHPGHSTEIAALLHRGEHVARAGERLNGFMQDLLSACAKAGAVRDDVSPDELANYCLHSLTAAASLPSKAAVRRLVSVTMAGLQPRA